jgi:glutamate--cysteine ligase
MSASPVVSHAEWLQQPLQPQSISDLSQLFKRSQRNGPGLIGLEHEKVSFSLRDGGPVPYFGPNGVHRLLLELCARFGWEPEHTEGYLLSLKRGAAHITLEPGGQVELSGSPFPALAHVRDELREHLQEVSEAGAAIGIGLSELGMHPLRNPFDIAFIPKPRYSVMRRYFQQSGARGLYMMGNTATVQVNLDFQDEAEAMEKMRAGQLASPFVSALFSNSPFEHGQDTGFQSRRYFTWLDVDRTRQGLVPQFYEEDASYDAYVKWALRAPMFGVHRDHVFVPTSQIPFGSFVRDGLPGLAPNNEDWFDHLGTLYPETRLKRTIELRGQDSGGLDHAMAVAGIWRGLLDHAPSRRAIIAAIPAPSDPRALQLEIARRGLSAEFAGVRALDWAWEVVRAAKRGLYALGDSLADTVLEPAEEALCEGIAPADLWRARLARVHTPADLLFGTRYPRKN